VSSQTLPSPTLTNLYRFLKRITSGEVEVTIDEFPNFLYDEGEAEQLLEENPNVWNAEKGLLRSSLCLWVRCLISFVLLLYQLIFQSFKCIFMGNGFSEATDKKKKSAISKINGLAQVTPSTIVYAMAQVSLSSQSQFRSLM
jgi:hypothetical protein